MAARSNPKWLQPLWETKKSKTAERVEQAIEELIKQSKPVTLDTIRHAVKDLFELSISANTIQRNERAHTAYLKHRTARRVSRPGNSAISMMLRDLSKVNAVNLRAKINRLRRESKNDLIARLLQLEGERKRQANREDALREEILRLHPSTQSKGGAQ